MADDKPPIEIVPPALAEGIVVPHQALGGISTTDALLESLTSKLTQILSHHQASPSHAENSAPPIAVKLDGRNYGLWSQVIEMYISGKDKLGYINGDFPTPLPTDPNFRKWKTDDSIVKGWLINSMDPALIGNFIRFPTAKAVWDSVATTFFDGTDVSQVGGPIEKYYNDLQGLWREVDFRRPNPMTCPRDIERYNALVQEDRVYLFLDGLDDRLDKVRADVLQMHPLPTVEQAYARVRREDVRQAAMLSSIEPSSTAAALSKALQMVPLNTASGGGRTNKGLKAKPKHPGGCTHCGNTKHTKDTCFKLHGYLDWWKELQDKKKTESSIGRGQASLATGTSPLSLVPQLSKVIF
ncbi:hypothetical protein EUGRSUZ_K01505 [Eucalyptus grandis]|uniref:Uncharacterized protein n=2 Tax=Eucalyptus grandis TaxID=71139 RepID=A0ACC3ITW8_EUCGR|nr:hypothetical protein EUGRSUZ_K01505 [Eucalyptus grandis]